MGWIQIINTHTNEIELEVGVRPDRYADDDEITASDNNAYNKKPSCIYREIEKLYLS